MDATKFSKAEEQLVLALLQDLRAASAAPIQASWDVTKQQTLLDLQADALEHLLTSYYHAIKPQVTTTPPPPTEAKRFAVILTNCGDKKIQVIKETRAIVPGLGLKEAKDMVDKASPMQARNTSTGMPYGMARPGVAVALLESVEESEAKRAVAALEMAGATAHYECTSATPEEIQAARDGMVRVYQELSDPCPTCGNKGKIRNPAEVGPGMHINTVSYVPCPDCP